MGQLIAVIGMSCKASGINNLDDYWQVISQGKSTLKRYSNDELRQSGIDETTLNDTSYVPVGGELEGADVFDAEFFGIPPKEALYMDPQHRKFLEVTYSAFEDAGISPENYDGFAGVFAGCSQNNYRLQNIEKTQAGRQWSEFQKQIASDKDFLATQVAYKLGLRGPALTIQSACSTSLVAVDTACKYLNSGQCDIAVAGGAYINVPLKQGYQALEGGILSATGECRAFDSGANGTIFSPGVGVVILKPLEQAIEDGNDIYGVIESTATNNDGNKKVSYTAPGFDGQAEVITMAQAMADIEPEDIAYVEAHGTGTKLGDPLEIQALTNAFRLGTDKNQYCVIGSVKPNIGHCDVAAGVMGLIKICLCLTHKVFPPQINYNTINPEIDIKNSPFVINTNSKAWPDAKNGKRIAAVSSFGVGGTNAHAIVSEAPTTNTKQASQSIAPLFFPICGESAESVAASANELGQRLGNNEIDLASAIQAASRNADNASYRDCVVASTVVDASKKLLSIKSESVAKLDDDAKSLIFMFPGQGSQHVDMGRELYEKEVAFRESMDKCFAILDGVLEYDLKQVLYPSVEDRDSAAEFLKHTEVAQPALFSVSYSTAQLLQAKGVKPDKMVGHSIGEYVAACLSGVFSLEDALKIVAKRGQLMQAMDAGSMLAVIADLDTVESELPSDLSIAAVNSPSITVVSGETAAIQKFEASLSDRSIRTVPLHTSHAFHSHMMEPMLEPFVQAFENVKLQAPGIPFSSCVSGELISASQCQSPQYWADQVRSPVLFSKCITDLIGADDAICLEVGSSNALTSAMSAHDFSSDVLSYNTLPPAARPDNALEQFTSVLGNLWKHTQLLDLQYLMNNDIELQVAHAGRAFKQDRYWIDYSAEQTQVAMAQIPAQADASAATGASVQTPMEEELKTLLHALSGIQFDDGNRNSEFISLGFESLLAAEVRGTLKSKLEVDVEIPELMSTYNSFEKLLAYCVSQRGETVAHEAPANIPQQTIVQTVSGDPGTMALADQESSIAALRKEIQEQSKLIKQLIEQRDASVSSVVSSGNGSAVDNQSEIAADFMPRPNSEARLGKDPEGNPNWYVPDPQNPGQYRIVSQ